MKNKNEIKNPISYNVEITHPTNKLRVEFVIDTIYTVDGGTAHIPYGGTSSEWGKSNVIFTEQYGVPSRLKIVFYALYEDVFYDLDVQLPEEEMIELMDRAYAIRESTSSSLEMKEFIKISEYPNFEEEFNLYNDSYAKVSDFVLGFTPQGKVTVWLRYNRVQKLIGEYQASPIKNDEQVAERFYSEMAIGREEARDLFYIEKSIPDIWTELLFNSKWKISPVVLNTEARILEINMKCFDKTAETLLRPWLLEDVRKLRGIPEMIRVTWETGKDEAYYANIFYDWETISTSFIEKDDSEDNVLKMEIGEDNRTIKTFYGGQEIRADRIRIFKNEIKYRD